MQTSVINWTNAIYELKRIVSKDLLYKISGVMIIQKMSHAKQETRQLCLYMYKYYILCTDYEISKGFQY